MRIFLLACLTMICFSVISLEAQHVSEDMITVGPPEHELAGIKVYGMKLKEAIAIYGQPSSQEKDKQGLPVYIWQKSGLKLQVGTAYDNPENVYSVEVWGKKPSRQLGRTSRGLTLGGDLEAVKKHYGSKLIQHSPSDAMVMFRDDTALTVSLDEKGRINHISLVGAVE
jgi:hypothetical protein